MGNNEGMKQTRVIQAVLDVFDDGETFSDEDVQQLLPDVPSSTINRALHNWADGAFTRRWVRAATAGAKLGTIGNKRGRRWTLYKAGAWNAAAIDVNRPSRHGIHAEDVKAPRGHLERTVSPARPEPPAGTGAVSCDVVERQEDRLLIRVEGTLYVARPLSLVGAA